MLLERSLEKVVAEGVSCVNSPQAQDDPHHHHSAAAENVWLGYAAGPGKITG